MEEIIATDGSCFNNGQDNAIAGAGIFFEEDDPRNRVIRLPEEIEQSNQTAEVVAVKEAVQDFDDDTDLKIESDSKHAINAVTKNMKKWEDRGYIGVANKELHQAAVATLRQRKRKTKFRWVKAHDGHIRNEGADRKADEGTRKTEPDEVKLDVPPTLRVTGAKLATMTQSLAYKAIRASKMKSKLKKRTRTKINIEKAKAEAEDNFGYVPTEGKIWRSFRNKDLSRQQQHFLWMTTHDAYLTGTHWLRDSNSEEKRERGECQHCGKVDSMEHILTQCEVPGQKEVWALAKELWEKRNPEWPWPGLGAIITSGVALFKNKDGVVQPGDARLYRILMAESAYQIWLIRCDRVLKYNGVHPTEMEIQNRWVDAMNARLRFDCNATHRKWEKKALPVKTVLNTWKGVLMNESKLPDDWTGASGVLVGITAGRQQEERRER
ncbi:ribonuclease H-like domain-containing protein [Mycena crocata]|nr:ribonuclease H-like domain-containing protein [Mycena crocata]